MRSVLTVLMIVGVCAARPSAWQAGTPQIPVLPAASAYNDSYNFALTVVESMVMYSAGEEGVANYRRLDDPIADVGSQLAAWRTTQAKWQLAQSTVDKYSNSKEPYLAKVASALAIAYGAMSNGHAQRVAMADAILRKPSRRARAEIGRTATEKR